MKKILVIKLDHIGDLILSTPALRSIRNSFPAAQLDVLVSAKSKGVLEKAKYIDRIYTYESRDFDRGNRINSRILAHNIATINHIRRLEYDFCVGLREDLSNIPIQKLCGAKENISFSTNTSYSKFLDQSVENDANKHVAEINFDLLSLLNIERPADIRPEISFSQEDRTWAANFLKSAGISEPCLKIGLSIGGGWYQNWWPIENFVQLGAMIKDLYGDSVELIVVGGKAEEKLLQSFDSLAGYKYISAVNKTTILQMIALFEQFDFVVSNDGGLMHMATAAGTPVIALFGPSPHRRFGPLGPGHTIISKNFPCSPCPQFVQGQAAKCADNQCMKQITVNEVFDVVKQYMYDSMVQLEGKSERNDYV